MLKSRLTASLAFLLLGLLLGCSSADNEPAATPVAAEEGIDLRTAAVAMPDSYGAAVAEQILKAGGNAVDAGIAAGLALAVTYPEAGNIGGGGFMLIHMNGEDSFIDYREKAPGAADRDMYLDVDGNVIEGLSLVGHLAVGVPGTVAGFWEAHQRFGTMPWRDLVMPAVKIAEEGFVVPDKLGGGMLTKLERYEGKTNFGDYFGRMESGELHKQPELAATLGRIAENGVDEFYKGKTAELIVAEMERGNGLITMQDLADYEAVWREPVAADWRGYRVVSAPLPSSGGFGLVQLLKIHDYIAHHFKGVAHNSAQYVHLVAEIEKRVFADRAQYLGDPDFIDWRVDELLSDDYIRRRAQEINPDAISMDVGPGTGLEAHDTTHYSILDQWGNAVSNTYTLNLGFGSGVVVTGAGFLLNDEMDDFSIKAGVPNAYGVVGSEANQIEPGKRMLSSMTPTILLRDGKVAMVVGTPGGSTIFTSVFQVILNVLDFDMSPLEATGAARFHHQLLPPDLILMQRDSPLPEETLSVLGDRGYKTRSIYNYGDVQMIYDDGKDVQAASDPRNRGESRVVKLPAGASSDL
ncbi:MAG: gamma-glutamyltransferase [Gammaproteobacteria bacterium]|nr:gamma-glutamyltransferase [Gammaproteobacteria bacterium]MDH3482148.1 gamma-glutamyltransferase [Gammaproteobacteria bacterium]